MYVLATLLVLLAWAQYGAATGHIEFNDWPLVRTEKRSVKMFTVALYLVAAAAVILLEVFL